MFLSVTSINMIVRYNTIVHPYLLADNRHYTFYVWKRLFEYRPWVRFVLFPAYAFGAYAVRQILKQRQSFLFVTAFFLCTFVSLVPQRLLEIRYFFIPFVLFRLHVPAQSGAALVLEFLAFVVVNTAALYLFVARPFYWDDTPLVQRFMWWSAIGHFIALCCGENNKYNDDVSATLRRANGYLFILSTLDMKYALSSEEEASAACLHFVALASNDPFVFALDCVKRSFLKPFQSQSEPGSQFAKRRLLLRFKFVPGQSVTEFCYSPLFTWSPKLYSKKL